MARYHRIQIRKNLRDLVSKDLVSSANQESGLVQRCRKLGLQDFLWTLIWGFGVGGDRTISALHRTYRTNSTHAIGESAFAEWFRKAAFPKFMRCLVGTSPARTS